ncbi:type VI secretion system amidase effector protein Tae4 [Brenneria goodwinii]|uniref:type VI secretion system amidase effector protein Tae4 n=1 Tax=Brenneria goodwinii TaxID=1109412 RepID=UPI0036E439FD
MAAVFRNQYPFSDVGKRIGGNVGLNIKLGEEDSTQGFTNSCAIIMSYALNYSYVKIERGPWKTLSGSDKSWYIFRVKDLIPYLRYKFGAPDKIVKNPVMGDFSNMKGILVLTVDSWNDASGHAALWNGLTCSNHCYFPQATEAAIWLLK